MTPNPVSGGVMAENVRNSVATAGLGPGTLIHTLHGDRMIETLTPGDRVLTPGAGSVRLDAITRTVAPTRSLCRIAPDALSDSRSGRRAGPVITSHRQILLVAGWLSRAMFGRDQALVPVSAMVDGDLVHHMTLNTEIPLFQLHFRRPTLFRAGGLYMLGTPHRKHAH
ncbi:hypothetical protein GCM10016455_02710 [Aliiroseovarius zhejiangensis]|uniref:Hedgehog/Intein (Hint) domain-containing protein n=1 Tax=Aliiroseovarius zhejiangensis TaxID=1632025 RepID=A0ABQ3INU0_9RHOB|nr:Hint domain-containing protein [Aliiroseovarius zhejiangensis]GHE86546.1 hypothetical protein GCM10016455_02710 [Aliiroseovarius zhejiangensis]